MASGHNGSPHSQCFSIATDISTSKQLATKSRYNIIQDLDIHHCVQSIKVVAKKTKATELSTGGGNQLIKCHHALQLSHASKTIKQYISECLKAQ